MRKHFLILMLMALLPMAGWATDITDVDITLTPNATTGMHYTGTDSAFPTIVVSGKNGSESVTNIVASNYATVSIAAKVVVGNTASMSDFTPGTYVVTVTATDGNTVTGTLTKEFEIVNAEIATTDPVLNDPIYTGTPLSFSGNYGVTYDGQAHQVIKTAAQASVTSSIAGSMTIYYSLNATGTGAPSTTEDVWYTDITAAQLAVTNAGTYDIYYRVDHTNPWVENTAAILNGKTYKVSKANPTVTELPTAKELTYTSLAQNLINTGTANGGVMVYKLDDAAYGTTNVSPKATNYKEGGYTVKYKIVGDENHNDYEPTWGDGTGGTTKPITVTINKKLLKVKPVAINTFFGVVDDADVVAITYDGFVGNDWYEDAAPKVSVFAGSYTAPVGAYSSTINIAANKTTLSDNKKYFNVGTYTNGLVATASDANTGAANYELVYQSNNMTISAAAVKLTLNDGPAVAYYGTPEASVASWPVKYADVVTATPAYTGKLTVEIQNGVNGQNEPTYAAAAIGDLDKYLVITDETNPADNVFEGLTISRANTAVTPQKYALTLSGATATSNTYIAEEVLANENVVFEIKKATIAITPDTDWKIYGDADPEQLTYKVTLSGVPYALTDAQVTAVNAAISRAAGESVGDYKITIAESAKSAFDTDSYTITLNTSWFSIEKRNLIITALPQTLYIGDKESEKLGKAESVNWTIEGIQTINGVKDAYNTVSLAFNTSAPVSVPTTGTGANKALAASAATTGYDGTIAPAAGVWVNGIKITIGTAQQTALAKNYNITLNFGTLTVVDPTQVLVLNSTLDNTDGITAAAEAGVNVDVTVTGRTLAADTWSVLVLPFTISTYDFIQDLGCYAVFNRLKSAEGTNVKFGLELSELKANEPFLVKPQAAITTDMLFDGVEIVDLTPSKTVGSATFVGTYAPINPLAVEAGMYIPQGGKFVPYTTQSTYAFPATMAYLLVNATGEARITVEEADGSTTAISNISADGVAMKADGWYTVNGVKLQGMPTEKGIYINNGKKVVIK